MRLHRFFIDKNDQNSNFVLSDNKIVISDTEITNQLLKVFRYSIGQKVIFFDGSGFDYIYEITKISSKNIDFSFVEKNKNNFEKKELIVIFSIIKKQNSELLIQKCTELGASGFEPIISERTEKKNFDFVRAIKIATESTEQSGRDFVPTIKPAKQLSDFLEINFSKNKKIKTFVFDIDGKNFTKKDLSQIHNDLSLGQTIQILIGPEGGWTKKEIDLFKKYNLSIYKINTAILRAETAGITISALCLFDIQ
ncbi:MAG TPA: 16S rRNA (uracil(1498)-N(3))-methyltransferase [Candidatus Paceibacterota bacterium]|nr:16S rRNA (uracil(1498)-N(3))-methyltransferase [Candidatus Paceibacterota bacterium]HMP18927.1 16S rRNA (uracil(1498)-N(3))-methyltransferase [Candidatus Paceibacterota bacterium]HMP85090.1 16S rRNA (uracil(1498)-N(3))-methyltransferase [Candidatus Paceibacterota bacterium]